MEDYSEDSHTGEFDPLTKKLKRRFIKGKYVMRITVNPSNNGKTYFWKNEDKLIMTIREKSVLNSEEARRRLTEIEAKEISEIKSAEFSECENLSDEERFYLEKPASSFDHTCK